MLVARLHRAANHNGSATIELLERGLLRDRRWLPCLRESGRSVQCLGPAEHPQVYRCAAVRYCARNRIGTIADSRRSGKSYAIYKPVRVTTCGSILGLHGPSETHRCEQVLPRQASAPEMTMI